MSTTIFESSFKSYWATQNHSNNCIHCCSVLSTDWGDVSLPRTQRRCRSWKPKLLKWSRMKPIYKPSKHLIHFPHSCMSRGQCSERVSLHSRALVAEGRHIPKSPEEHASILHCAHRKYRHVLEILDLNPDSSSQIELWRHLQPYLCGVCSLSKPHIIPPLLRVTLNAFASLQLRLSEIFFFHSHFPFF